MLDFVAALRGIQTADSPEGVIHYIKYDGGFQLLTGPQQLITDRNPRVVACWQAAFDRLLQMGLLKDNERNGERFHLSPEGFDAVDQIRQQDLHVLFFEATIDQDSLK